VVARKTFQGMLQRNPTQDEMGRLFAQYMLHLPEDIWQSPGLQGAGRGGTDADEARRGRRHSRHRLAAMEGAARTKLARANFNRFFVFGGLRFRLVQTVPHSHSSRSTKPRSSTEICSSPTRFVIGDSPHDVEAARAVGAVAVAVASGRDSEDDLRAAGVDYVLPSLTTPFPRL
jgi:phosphoglycolate phosphatase